MGDFLQYIAENKRLVRCQALDLIHLCRRAFKRNRFALAPSAPAPADSSAVEPIAIIGINGRFPQAQDIGELWCNLLQGRDCVGELPPERWGSYAGELGRQPGGVLEGVDQFDPLFFGISHREAEGMDPQQRLLMMSVWAALEDAGYAPHSLAGSATALLIGTGNSGYAGSLAQAGASIERHSAASAMASLGPNRMSYLLDLHGPSEPIETACSSALVAIHRAVQLLQSGQCALAIAGGVNVLANPRAHMSIAKLGVLSPAGRCKTFAAQADGYVRGEGVGVLVLKKLSAAEHDHDHIYAVIRGSAQNHGGRAKSLTAPNPRAQAELIKAALRQAQVAPHTVSYIEAHGTGTPVGDPIEVEGLKTAFRELAQEQGQPELTPARCALASVKSNIGHLELAAGVAGVIKTVLQMQHRTLVKSLHSDQLNPRIELKDSPFYIVREAQPWRTATDAAGRPLPRRAGVSSFGFGGVNAHVVLEEYVGPERLDADLVAPAGPSVVVVSAKNEERLKAQVRQLLVALREADEGQAQCPASEAEGSSGLRRGKALRLCDIAYTLQVGREAMECRVACVVSDLPQLCARLEAWLAGDKAVEDVYQGQTRQHKEALGLFAGDELQETLGKWIERGKLDKLAELWAKGLAFDWGRLYGDRRMARPRRISLPTYPFAKERYWIEAAGPERGGSDCNAAVGTEAEQEQQQTLLPRPRPFPPIGEAPALMLFEERWQACPLESSALKSADGSIARTLALSAQTLVCFLSEPNRRQAFAQSLFDLSPHTQVVFIGCVGEQAATGEDPITQGYEVSPGDRQSFLGVLREIQTRHSRVDAMLYLWPLEGESLIRDPIPWVGFVQALAESGLGCRRVVLAGYALHETAQTHLESWIGAERSIGLALPETRITVMIEAALGSDGSDVAPNMGMWARWLLGELHSGSQSVLYRGGVRHTCSVHELVETETAAEPQLRRGGTYLITGGGGGLGSIFATHLARGYGANLVLTGRSAPGEAIARQVRELEALGSQVLYAQADVSDETAMGAVIERVRQRFGGLNGVIHAAGVASDGVRILQKTAEAFERTLLPKVEGTLVLDRLLRDQPLDFLCYFSSSSAVLGDFGSCDYAMGNRFLIAHARARSQRVLRGEARGKTLAICWPLWDEGGMGFGVPQQTDFYLKSSGQQALGTVRGIEIFEQLLRGSAAQPLVMVGEPTRLRRMLSLGGPSSEHRATRLVASPAMAERGKGRRPEMQGFTLVQCIEWDLKQQILALLMVPREQLDLETNLADFGFDSISLTEFAKRLSAHYAIDLTPALFFSYPSLARLVEYLLTAYRPVLEDFYWDNGRSESKPPSRLAPTPASIAPVLTSAAPITASLFTREPIAIIGMSGRFPGARTVEDFWSVLREGQDLVKEVPPQRFDWRHYYGDPVKEPGKTNGKWLGSLEGVDEFDPLFFDISPREAETMDPRQRLLLQEAWRALEDAGYGREQLEAHSIGMFVGVEQGDYQHLVAASGAGAGVTNHDAILAARLAYQLDLQGPVIATNTACSSGLVAAHQACQSLRAGECETAIAAGVSLVVTPQAFIRMAQAGMLSDDGRCHAFGQEANGMVPGEAIVAVVLKRLSQAQAEGDPILAVIQGSGINYDGKTNGITAPSGAAQARLLKDVYRLHGIDPGVLEYVVAHGTGTRLGDPIEVNALCEVFGEHTSEKGFCALTSTKGNVGHTFAASGLVSLVGLVQAMRHELIPPSLHCEQESDYVRWSDSPFYVNRQARAWPKRAHARLGAVSAFGISGTNAHMVVASWDAEAAVVDALPCQLLALSAKTAQGLAERMSDMLQLLQSKAWTVNELQAISHTLLVGRQHFTHRCAIVVEDTRDAIDLWQQASGTQNLPNLFRSQVPRGFTPRRALLGYAQQLLERTSGLIDDSEHCRENLQALGELYCQGYELRWSPLFGRTAPRRISLPTYPFAKESYWVSDKRATAVQSGASEAYVPLKHNHDPGNSIQIAPSTVSSLSAVDRAGANQQDLLKIVSEITGHSAAAILETDNFQNLGIDSIQRIQLVSKVLVRFPQLEVSADEMLAMPSLSSLLSTFFVADPVADTSTRTYEGSESEEYSRLDGILAKIKDRPETVVCHSLRVACVDPLSLTGTLIVDEGHPFFSDHPLDHVSGVHLIEAMNQMCQVATKMEACHRDQVLTNMRIDFSSFCEKRSDATVKVSLDVAHAESRKYSCTIVQEGRNRLTGSLTFSAMTDLGVLDPKATRELEGYSLCKKSIVNKTQEQNVFISGLTSQSGKMGCWVRPADENAVCFFGQNKQLVDTIYLVEACRQSARLFGEHAKADQSNADATSADDFAEAFGVLKSIEMSTSRPLGIREAVFIEADRPTIIKAGTSCLADYRCKLSVDDVQVGSFEMQGIVLSANTYAKWRPAKGAAAVSG